MSTSPQDQDWEERLKSTLGTAPEPDFDAWCARNADAVATLQAKPASTVVGLPRIPPNRRTLLATSKWVAALLLIVAGLVWLGSGQSLSTAAFADPIPGIDDVQTMTWTETYYVRYTSEDGKRTWIVTEDRHCAYRHPGQYRETHLNKAGDPISVHITDNRAGRMLSLDVKDKKAVLKHPAHPRGERTPFAWIGDEIRERKNGDYWRVKSLSLQGQKKIDKVQANVVRLKLQNVEDLSVTRQDVLFDATSKGLVGIWQPSKDLMDLEFETAVDPAKPAEETWSKLQPVASLIHEMVVDPKLSSADFSLDAPEGFALEKLAKPTVTEEEMLVFLGAAARFNAGLFPDSPYKAIDSDKFNAACEQDAANRTPELLALIEIRDKIMMREIYQPPVLQFEKDQTVPASFHYVGSDVKVGQADRIVGWYQLRGSKKYRAFFGDLSVKDVTEAELPLKITK